MTVTENDVEAAKEILALKPYDAENRRTHALFERAKHLADKVLAQNSDAGPQHLCTLHDKGEGFEGEVSVRVEARSSWVELYFDGYGTAGMEPGHGSPIGVELYQGELRLVLNPNINDEDPKVFSLEGARETLRQSGEAPT